MSYREEALEEAAHLTTADRNRNYGDPKDNHERIAKIWSVILGREISPTQVALCMAGLKLARLAYDETHEDSYIDGIAYLAIAYEIEKRK